MAKQKGIVHVTDDRCKGCELCVHACPVNILELDKSKINSAGLHPAKVIDGGICIGCTNCAIICPDSAIEIEKVVNTDG